ncbi:MAG TPA: TlpA disulfide reductase family protein [Isosphaeraceae bacterium]
MTMQALRRSCLTAVLLLAPAAAGAAPTVPQMLAIKPAVEGAAVEYDVPTDQAAIAACVVEPSQAPSGWVLRDGQGKILRKFVAVGGPGINQWRYYQDGFEVYREFDSDSNKTVDEARWMNSAGTRIAAIAEKNRIVSWKRISAEEASKVLVQAIVANDPALAETVMAQPDELTAMGIPATEVERAEKALAARAQALAALKKGLAGWDQKTVWLRFDAPMPHVIPSDASAGLKGDLTLYENAVILAGQAGGVAPGNQTAFLQSGELVKVGETWKFVDLPRAINPANNVPVVAMEGGIRSAVYRESGGPGGNNPVQEEAIRALANYDNANADKLNNANKQVVADYYIKRVPYLRAVEQASKNPDEILTYVKQKIDCVASAYQTGVYPEGLKRLKAIEAERVKYSSYAAFRRINADFNLEGENQANPVASQNRWMKDMKQFLEDFPKSDEEPEVLFQLASTNEFSGEEAEARTYYGRLVSAFPDTLPGKKAAGALRRLDSVGKALAIRGKTLDGPTIDSSQLKGKTVLIAFWATSVKAWKQDAPEIAKIYDKMKAKGFEVISVCLDNDAASLTSFLKETPLPWPTIFEPGGMESRLGVEFGIVALPTMILIDADGKAINRAMRNAADLDIQLEKALAGKSAGVAARAEN